MKKYKLTEETKKIEDTLLFRIQALRSFKDVQEGEFGGWVEREANLSQEDNCWIYGEGVVFQNASVSERATVHERATVSGNAVLRKNAVAKGTSVVKGEAYANSFRSIAWLPSVGKDNADLTAYLTAEKGIEITHGSFYGSIESFEEEAKKITSPSLSKEHLEIASFLKKYLKEHVQPQKNQ